MGNKCIVCGSPAKYGKGINPLAVEEWYCERHHESGDDSYRKSLTGLAMQNPNKSINFCPPMGGEQLTKESLDTINKEINKNTPRPVKKRSKFLTILIHVLGLNK